MKDLKKEEKVLEDPRQIYRPDVPDYEEKTKDFRNYGEDNALFDRVKKTYLDMHTNQTVEYVQSMHKKVPLSYENYTVHWSEWTMKIYGLLVAKFWYL